MYVSYFSTSSYKVLDTKDVKPKISTKTATHVAAKKAASMTTRPSTDELCYESALGMAAKIRAQEITSRELVEMHIARIKLYNDRINAIIAHDFDDALRRADQADKAVRDIFNNISGNNVQEELEKKLGPFHGVPITMKESIFTPGFRSTCGDPKAWLPPGASCKTAKILIEKGGAILLGKTNLCMNLVDWESNNPIYGKTCNPYDVARSPGGSSGGAAAALAAGFTPLELGTDLGGSIRIPAAMCGVVGHCGTRGLIPRPNPMYGWSWVDRFLANKLGKMLWMSRAGPLARTVEDVIKMVELLGGDEAARLPRRPSNSSLSGCRIGFWRSHDVNPPGREVNEAMTKVAKALEAAGAIVEELEPPVDPMQTYVMYLRFLGPVVGGFISEQQKLNTKKGCAKDSFPSSMRSPLWEMDMSGVLGVPKGTQEAYEDAARCWDDHLRENYDAVLSPIFPCDAWLMASEPDAKLPNNKTSARPIVIDGEERCYGDALFWSHLSVLCGLPSTSFPICLSERGLPIGLQAFGCKGSDFVLLDIVSQLVNLLGSNFIPPAGFGDSG